MKDSKPTKFGEFLADESIPVEKRREMLQFQLMTLMEPGPDSDKIFNEIIEAMKKRHSESLFQKKCEKLDAKMKELEAGPLRGAIFVSSETDEATKSTISQVILDDGQFAYCSVPDEKLAEELKKGDRILLDKRGCAVLRRAPEPLKIGDEAKLERSLDGGYVEVSIRDHEKSIFFPNRELEEKIADGKVSPGDTLIVNTRQSMAFDAVPPSDSLSHFKFICKEPVPDVIAERDIGSPPEIIERIISPHSA